MLLYILGCKHGLKLKLGAEKPLRKFAQAIPDMYPHAKEWLKIFHKRILNDEPSRRIYAKVISSFDSSIKTTVIDIVEQIMKKNPNKFEMAVNEFLNCLT